MSNYSVAFFSGLSFMLGAMFSAFSGYAGIWVSVRANVRVASAARNCYNTSIKIAFQGGYFAAVINVALAILGYANIYNVNKHFDPLLFDHGVLLLSLERTAGGPEHRQDSHAHNRLRLRGKLCRHVRLIRRRHIHKGN